VIEFISISIIIIIIMKSYTKYTNEKYVKNKKENIIIIIIIIQVGLCMQDYRSPRVAVMIYGTLVNT